MKSIKEIFILITGAILLCGCNKNENCKSDSHNTIIIQNQSTSKIHWLLFTADTVANLDFSPEIDYNLILPNSISNYNIRNETCWEEYFNTVNGGFQYLLLFSNDTISALGWQAISGTNRGLLKRVKVDLNYLQQNNFTISYP